MPKAISFSAQMARAILTGRKTQTRRAIRLPHNNPLGIWEPTTVGGTGVTTSKGIPYPERPAIWHTRTGDCIAPPINAGDVLYIREPIIASAGNGIRYEADNHEITGAEWKWKPHRLPGIYMPRELSRITIRITDVRVERLHDISENDARAEGISPPGPRGYHVADDDHGPVYARSPITAYAHIWNAVSGKGGPKWDANPWVFAYSFLVEVST